MDWRVGFAQYLMVGSGRLSFFLSEMAPWNRKFLFVSIIFTFRVKVGEGKSASFIPFLFVGATLQRVFFLKLIVFVRVLGVLDLVHDRWVL